MKWSLTDTMWEVTSLLLREIALLTVGRLLFFTFGFESERPWQFVLFMMAFLLLNISLNFFGKKILGWVQQNMGIREEQHLAFLDAMYEFLIAGGLRLCCLSGRQRAAGQDVETMASKKQGIISLLFSFIGEKVCAPCAAR